MDVAYGILYLACAESKYVTGVELTIDGGILPEVKPGLRNKKKPVKTEVKRWLKIQYQAFLHTSETFVRLLNKYVKILHHAYIFDLPSGEKTNT